VKLWNVYCAEPSRSGLALRYVGQVRARSEAGAHRAIAKLADCSGLTIVVRAAELDPWVRQRVKVTVG